ncbi:glycosyltransferase family 4 protein [Iningainema tapete]|uniref:Glycosyltransferase n=1 Tax=Iningainema tapete BLCC-T55 TaxID=2748662 RepID=A0A8J7C6U0_9CYAN|nr:glycosyltransferase [Iningainema tapete]MBD2772396.1 glycosyltransferase [Iningainema tapete BLCC-T55]
MKVLLFGSLIAEGGIQTHTRWLSRSLAEAGIKVLIVTPEPIQESELNSLETNEIQVFPFKSVGVKANFLAVKFEEFRNLVKVARSFEPDVYFGVGTGWNLSILPLALSKQVRTIFYEVMSGVPFGWRDARWGVRWWFNEVVGQSPTVAKTFASCFGWKKTVPAIPAIPEPLELTATLPQTVIKTVELGKAKAAFFSRLAPHKQAFWLVQQWDLLKDLLDELHIYGSGPEEEPIRDYINSRGLGDRVKCLGRYPEGQAYVDLLCNYDLTLLPTIGAEGAPLVLLESMACGVPFVAYGVGGIPDYAVDNPNSLVVPPEPKAFISGVRQMVHRLARGDINQVQLQQFYLQRYSYEVLKKSWLSYLCSQ